MKFIYTPEAQFYCIYCGTPISMSEVDIYPSDQGQSQAVECSCLHDQITIEYTIHMTPYQASLNNNKIYYFELHYITIWWQREHLQFSISHSVNKVQFHLYRSENKTTIFSNSISKEWGKLMDIPGEWMVLLPEELVHRVERLLPFI